MKTIIVVFLLLSISISCLAQLSPVNDTLIPEQHKRDTIQYEPKLQGGALIDTINTDDPEFKHLPLPIDTPKSFPPKKEGI